MTTEVRAEDLEKRLDSLLEIEKLPQPEDFRKQALITDESIYEEAATDLEAFWAKQAEELIDWAEKPTQILAESNAPFYKWFADGKLNLSYNCVDRHVEAGNGDRVAYHWRGEEGEEREITYADLHRDVQRFANALKARGIGKGDVVGIYLPMIPEVVVAMLACARIGAPHNVVFGGFSAEAVRERMEFSRAKALVTVEGAHRPGQARGGRGARRRRVDRDDLRRPPHRGRVRDARGARRLVWRGDGGGRAGVPARADGRRGPALHPLHLRLDREAEGHPPHHRRLPGRRRLHPPLRLRPQARGGRLLVRRRRRLGHRPLLHRLRPARQCGDQRDLRGGAGLPRQGHLVGADRALRGDDLLHRADGDPRLHEMGRRIPRAPRPQLAAPARLGRRADQPQGLALVPQGDRRRELPDRRHLVADRDRPHHDLSIAGDNRDQARLGDAAAARDRGRGRRRCRRTGRGR